MRIIALSKICLSVLLILLLYGISYAPTAAADALPLEATMISLDHQNFPFVYLNVAVDRSGEGISTLTKSNFQVTENGVLQTDYFDVVPPQAGGGVRVVDIVFLMDNSGSMKEEQNAVRDNVIAFVNGLSASEIDFALGLCRFGAFQNGGNPVFEDSGILTSDPEYFKNDVWNRNAVGGGYEPGWDALYEAATSFAFRPGAQKVFILITDETVTNSGGANIGDYSQNEAIALLQANSVTVFALLNLSAPYEVPDHAIEDYGVIAEQTNGAYYDIFTAFDEILGYISSQVANTYLITYKSSRPVFDGVERHVVVTVSYSGDQATCEGTYIPGSAPRIRLTASTLALHEQPWAAGTEFTIEAEITDDVVPYVQSATLYYRTTGDATYASTSMTHSSDIWIGTIPGSAVKTPGVDYYISATDGESTATSPPVDPRTRPHQLAVLPNVAPQITHTPVTTAMGNTPVSISAEVMDTTNVLDSIELWYRKVGQLIFKTNGQMTNIGGDTYEDTIPSSYVTEAGVEYCILAYDDLGVGNWHGSFFDPHVITVSGNQAPETTIKTHVIDSANGTAKFTWSGSDDSTPPAQLVYEHRLLNPDSPLYGWSDWNSSTTATYPRAPDTRLPDGTYRFQVKAKDADEAIQPDSAVWGFTIGAGAPGTISRQVWVSTNRDGVLMYRDELGNPNTDVRLKQLPAGWVLRRITENGKPIERSPDGGIRWFHKVEDVTDSRVGWVERGDLDEGGDRLRVKVLLLQNDHPGGFTFEKNLYRDMSNAKEDIRLLQAVLKEEGSAIYPEGLITGYFGTRTEAAVKRLQEKYAEEILAPIGQTAGTGYVGPRTRTKLNQLLNNISFREKYELTKGRASVILESVEGLIDNPPKWLSADFLRGASPEGKIGIILAMIIQESWPEMYHFDNQFVACTPCGRGIMQIDRPDSYVGSGSGIQCYESNEIDYCGGNKCNRCCDSKKAREESWNCEIDCKCYYTNTAQGIEANVKDALWVLQEKYNQALGPYEYSDDQIINQEHSILGKELLWMSTVYRYNQGFPFKAQVIYEIWLGKKNNEIKIPGNYTDDWKNAVREQCPSGIAFEECLRRCETKDLIRSPFYLMNVGEKLEELNDESYFGTAGQGYIDIDLAEKMVYTNTHSVISKLLSPGKLRVYNSQGEVTGLVSGEILEEIGNAIYARESGILLILFPAESYIYEVEGTDEGVYGLSVLSLHGEERSAFSAADIPIKTGAIHQYTIDWDALARGEEGVTLEIDNDGDGAFEKTIQAGSTLDGTTTPIANQPPVIGILAPVSGESISGSHYQIQWQATDPDTSASSLSIDLFYSTNDGSTWTSISSNEANDGVYDWNISALQGGDYWLKVVAKDSDGGTSEATVGPFTISVFEGNIIVAPNPVTGTGTSFFYTLPDGTSTAKLMIFNVSGRPLFETALDVTSTCFPSAGTWNPVDQDGTPLANGPYVYVLVADGKVIGQGKMVIQR